MPLPIAPVLGVLADNLERRKSVLPLSRRSATGWAAGLGLPRGGKTVLYTGHMYQIMPALMSLEKLTSMFEDHWIAKYFGIGRMVNKHVNGSWFAPRADPMERRAYDARLRNIVRLLRATDVKELGYLYGEELYAGALIHDLGVDDVFEHQARRLHEMLRKRGVKRVITVDPHTTDMLRNVYPRFVPEFAVEVRSYLEVLADRKPEPKHELGSEVVIHDSCIYARSLDMVEEPRWLLENAGASVREPEYSGKLTFCCGGPAESLFPSRAGQIAARRMEQLARTGHDVAAMCPICLANLRNAAEGKAVTVRDISEYLVRAYDGSSHGEAWSSPSRARGPSVTSTA
jgi:Fe-S oxidoreductase